MNSKAMPFRRTAFALRSRPGKTVLEKKFDGSADNLHGRRFYGVVPKNNMVILRAGRRS